MLSAPGVCAAKAFTAARYVHRILPDPGMQSAETILRGSVLVLLQFDVCEAIRLDRLQELMRLHGRAAQP